MPRVVFTPNIQRHVACPEMTVAGATVREALENVFLAIPAARSYVLDDQSALRHHMTIFLDGEIVRDRKHLAVAAGEQSTIYVFQSLSGG